MLLSETTYSRLIIRTIHLEQSEIKGAFTLEYSLKDEDLFKWTKRTTTKKKRKKKIWTVRFSLVSVHFFKLKVGYLIVRVNR